MATETTIELTGTPDDVQAMLNAASKVEPTIHRKQKLSPGHYRLWYTAKSPPNDLVAAIKRRAGLTPSKRRRSTPRRETVPATDDVVVETSDGMTADNTALEDGAVMSDE